MTPKPSPEHCNFYANIAVSMSTESSSVQSYTSMTAAAEFRTDSRLTSRACHVVCGMAPFLAFHLLKCPGMRVLSEFETPVILPICSISDHKTTVSLLETTTADVRHGGAENAMQRASSRNIKPSISNLNRYRCLSEVYRVVDR